MPQVLSSVMPPDVMLDKIKFFEGKILKHNERLEELEKDITEAPWKILQNRKEKAVIMNLKKDLRKKVCGYQEDFVKFTGSKKAPTFTVGTQPVQDSVEKQKESLQKKLRQIKIILSKDGAKLEELVSRKKSANKEEKKKIEKDLAGLEDKICMLYEESRKKMARLEALKWKK